MLHNLICGPLSRVESVAVVYWLPKGESNTFYINHLQDGQLCHTRGTKSNVRLHIIRRNTSVGTLNYIIA